jgi:hypothetical protein
MVFFYIFSLKKKKEKEREEQQKRRKNMAGDGWRVTTMGSIARKYTLLP